MMTMKAPKVFKSKVEPTLTNRFFNLFSNKAPIPVGSMKKTPMGGRRMTEYNQRALGFLSERSSKVASMNLKKLKSKHNRNTLAKALNKTRRNR